jgi:hypothetical protein
MFNGMFLEGSTQSATLPDDDPTTFELFIGWLYLNRIETTAITELGLASIDALINIFASAEKYGISSLADNTMDAWKELLHRTNWLPSPQSMANGYNLTHEKSKLRVFLAKTFVYITLKCTLGETDEWWDKKSECLLKTNCSTSFISLHY